MNVSCPDCRSIFRVDPAKVPPSGVRARCSVCSGVISIPAPTGQATPAAGSLGAATPPAQPPSQRRPPSGQAPSGWESPPFSPQSQRTPTAPPAPRSAPPVAPPPAQRAAPPVAPPPPQRTAPSASPSPVRTTEAPAIARPGQQPGERGPVTATATPPSPSSGLPEFTPPPVVPPFSPPAPAQSSGPSVPPFVPSGPPPRPMPPPSRPPLTPPGSLPAVGDAGARRPLNPFLSKDPNQRAKRLARALVSDIITYHPAKHAEGLRDGTLKQLFREEIKKSFEEDIAQVGQQLAESTTYFQEALNEVLGAGKKIF
jgi:predicted Zn finger-like uncharacterized protein